MEKEPRLPNKEAFEKVDLSVKEPTPGLDSLWGIKFRTKNKKQNRAYNQAAEEVCKKHNLGPFHQVSGDFDSSGTYTGKGYHQWDVWKIRVETPPNEARNIIENLFEEIHTRAKEIATGN